MFMVHKQKTQKKMTTSQRIQQGKPLEVWSTPDGSWTWEVYRKYQKPKGEASNPYARWFCKVKSPFVPNGELGDVYIKDIKSHATKISEE